MSLLLFPLGSGGGGGGGSVNSVTGSAPIASSGGTDPNISISQATTSTDGYLSSTDWNTFNNKISSIPQNRTGYVDVVNGNDGTGVIGELTKPFASIAAAETAITTATDTNLFNLMLQPGVYDVIGLVKKPNINWIAPTNTWTRDSIVKIYTSDASTLDLASLGITGVESKVVFQGVSFECSIACDLYALDPVSTNHSTWTFINTSTFGQLNFVGRGADHDQIIAVNANYDDGFDFTSVTHIGSGVYTAGGTSLRANNGRGCQWLTSGSTILAAFLIQDVDNASVCIFGGTGNLVGGGITVDGTNAQAFLDASISINGSVVKTNGGIVNLLDRAQFVDCTNPFKDSSGVDSVDVSGRILKDAAGNDDFSWGARELTDSSGNDALNWETRTLRNTDTDVVMDWSDADQKAKFPGVVQLTVAGGGVDIKEGSNARMGLATLVGGTVTVSNTAVTANSRIFHSRQGGSGTQGNLDVPPVNIIPGTSFNIVSTSILDTSTVAWLIIEAL